MIKIFISLLCKVLDSEFAVFVIVSIVYFFASQSVLFITQSTLTFVTIALLHIVLQGTIVAALY